MVLFGNRLCGRDRSGYPTRRRRNEVEPPTEEYERRARIVRPKNNKKNVSETRFNFLEFDIHFQLLGEQFRNFHLKRLNINILHRIICKSI